MYQGVAMEVKIAARPTNYQEAFDADQTVAKKVVTNQASVGGNYKTLNLEDGFLPNYFPHLTSQGPSRLQIKGAGKDSIVNAHERMRQHDANGDGRLDISQSSGERQALWDDFSTRNGVRYIFDNFDPKRLSRGQMKLIAEFFDGRDGVRDDRVDLDEVPREQLISEFQDFVETKSNEIRSKWGDAVDALLKAGLVFEAGLAQDYAYDEIKGFEDMIAALGFSIPE